MTLTPELPGTDVITGRWLDDHSFSRPSWTVDELVAAKVEVDPAIGRAALAAAEHAPVEVPRGGEIVDGEGEVEGAKRHRASLHDRGAELERRVREPNRFLALDSVTLIRYITGTLRNCGRGGWPAPRRNTRAVATIGRRDDGGRRAVRS